MLHLSSINSTRKQHVFAIELGRIPSVKWMRPDLDDYQRAIDETVERLKTVDNGIETIIRNPDENIMIALSDVIYSEDKVTVRELRFPTYLPQCKVQLQRDLIRNLTDVAKGKTKIEDSANTAAVKFQKDWKVNPPVGDVKIDNREVSLRLHNSLGLFSSYLTSCEHEFYKKSLNAQLEIFMHYYRMALEGAEFRDEKAEPIIKTDLEETHHHLEDVLDSIYYSRGMDYFRECRNFWNFLDKNEHTRRYLLRENDLRSESKD